MNPDSSSSPFLAFRSSEDREYGSIRLFNPEEMPAGLPFLYSRFIVTPGSTSRRDQHSVSEMWIFLSGKGTLLLDGSEFNVKQGDVVHFASMKVHQVVNESTEDMEVCSFWWPNA